MKVCLWGLPGSGKTTVLPFLAKQLQLAAYDLDEILHQEHQQPASILFQQFGEPYFREYEAAQLRRIFENYDNFILACGGGTPCFKNNCQFLLQNAVCVWLNPDIQTIHSRLIADTTNTRPIFQNNTGFLDKLMTISDLRKKYYQQASIVCTQKSPDILWLSKQITKHWQELSC